MCKVIRPLAIAAVFVSAASSTLSIPVFSEGSEIVIRDGEESSPPEAEGHRMLRGKNEANQEAQEERGRLPIPREAFEASSSEALHMFGDSDAVLLQNLRSYYKEFFFQGHPVAYSYCVKLGVNLDDVPTSFAELITRLPEGSTIDNDKLFLMAIGNEYFKAEELRHPPLPHAYATPTGHILFRYNMDKNLFAEWKDLLGKSGYRPNVVFNKMRLLHGIIVSDKLDINQLVDYAYMAMGSELLSRGALNADGIPLLPTSPKTTQLLKRLRGDSPTRGETDEQPLTKAAKKAILPLPTSDRLNTKQLRKGMRDDSPARGETDEQPLTEAAKKAVGKDLTLGRGE